MREPLPTWTFVLVIVRLGRRYLLVRERKHGQTWYFPAGRVEPGETLEVAALRETQEESGVKVRLDGILRIERSYAGKSQRLRVIFVATPLDDAPPKSTADEESLQAGWFAPEEIEGLSLRSEECLGIIGYLDRGGPVYPSSLLTAEGERW